MGLGFFNAYKAGISFGKDDMVIPGTKEKFVDDTREDWPRNIEQQYIDGLITQGEKYNKVVDAWAKCTDRVADEMMKQISSVADGRGDRPREAGQLDLHDEPFGCARFAGADEAACRHARPDGQAVGRDHRDADHLELQGRPDRSRVLQLDARRPQGSCRHGAQDRQLRLSDPPPGRRGAGRIISEEDCGTKTAITARPIIDAGEVIASLGVRVLGRTAADDVKDPATGAVIVKAGEEILETACREDREGGCPRKSASARC